MNLDIFSLKRKVALITGAAGKYGRLITEALAQAGAICYAASRNTGKLQTMATEFKARNWDVRALHLDQGSEESIADGVNTIISECGHIDILVNNAVSRSATIGWKLSMCDYDASFHVNASGLFFLTNLVAENMKKEKSGSIINIGSIMGLVGVENANYAGTSYPTDLSPAYFYEKGGMINFTRHAASIFGPFNIRVNCVNPGGFETPEHDPVFVRQYNERTQLGRMAQPDDIKGIIILLASEASSYITGANIPVDGGYTAK